MQMDERVCRELGFQGGGTRAGPKSPNQTRTADPQKGTKVQKDVHSQRFRLGSGQRASNTGTAFEADLRYVSSRHPHTICTVPSTRPASRQLQRHRGFSSPRQQGDSTQGAGRACWGPQAHAGVSPGTGPQASPAEPSLEGWQRSSCLFNTQLMTRSPTVAVFVKQGQAPDTTPSGSSWPAGPWAETQGQPALSRPPDPRLRAGLGAEGLGPGTPSPHPVLLLGLQLLDPLQQPRLGPVQVRSQARDGDDVRLQLRRRDVNVHLRGDGGRPAAESVPGDTAPPRDGEGGGKSSARGAGRSTAPHPSTRPPGRRPAERLYLKLVHHLAYPTSLLANDVAVKVKGHLHFNGDRNQCLQDRAGVRPEGGGRELMGSAAGLPGTQGKSPVGMRCSLEPSMLPQLGRAPLSM